jgi:hypothetical protein
MRLSFDDVCDFEPQDQTTERRQGKAITRQDKAIARQARHDKTHAAQDNSKRETREPTQDNRNTKNAFFERKEKKKEKRNLPQSKLLRWTQRKYDFGKNGYGIMQ